MLHPLLDGARAVLFDAGGTLTHPDWERVARHAETETRQSFDTSQLRLLFHQAMRAVDARLKEDSIRTNYTRRPGWVFCDIFGTLGVEPDVTERLRLKLVADHRKNHLWCVLDPEVPEVLQRLREAGLKVGVISNTEDGRLSELIELVALQNKFDLLVDSYHVGMRKPDPAIFQYTVEKLGIEAQDAVYVGDSYGHDVLGAESAGLRAILLDPLDVYGGSEFPRIRRLSELTGDHKNAR